MFILSNLLTAIATVLDYALWIYIFILIGRAIISWVNADPFNPIVRFLYQATEPILYPIRRRLGLYSYGIDFSPIIVFLAIIFVRSFLIRTLFQLAASLRG